MYALDVTNGTELWSRTIGPVGWSSPAVSEGKVFIGTTDGKIYALYEESGDMVWEYQTGGPVDSSPAILNDTLYVGSKDGNIYAFRSQVHDINVTSVSPSRTEVSQGEIINIDVTIRNEGTFNETNINITAYYSTDTFSGKAGNITIPSLSRGTRKTEPIPWDTTNVTPGTYNISVCATPVPSETETLDNNKTDGPVHIRQPGIHNIKVTNVVPFKTVVGQNYSVSINVTIENEGALNETFNVTVYYNETAIILPDGKNYTTITQLTGGESRIATFKWNTTGVAKGNYTINAYAWPVLGGIDAADNIYVDSRIIVAMPCGISNRTSPD